jgi:LuxR family transcriptional regulator, maltose regulon positive regulatory protein
LKARLRRARMRVSMMRSGGRDGHARNWGEVDRELQRSWRVAALRAKCAFVPDGSQLLLAGRAEPQLGLARLRAERRLAELGRDELTLDQIEAGALLSAAGEDLTAPDVAELTRRTEGWAAGLYLAALSLREGGSLDPEAVSVNSGASHVADYLRSEVLSRLNAEEVQFLTRTAVLERMCGPLCDAVLEHPGAEAMLESLRRSNRLVVALDKSW